MNDSFKNNAVFLEKQTFNVVHCHWNVEWKTIKLNRHRQLVKVEAEIVSKSEIHRYMNNSI